MQVNRLYGTWLRRIGQLRPGERVTRVRNVAALVVGIYRSRSVHVSQIASQMPGTAKLTSLTRRLDRLLENPALRVREWYAPIAQATLARAGASGLRLIVDSSKVGFGHQLLMVALAYRRRALPLAWTWLKGKRGHSSSRVQLALLSYVKGLAPSGLPVTVMGDAEFGAVEVLRQLEQWGWGYVLRQKSSHLVRAHAQASWQSIGSLIQQPGQQAWHPGWQLTHKYAHPTHLLAYWRAGQSEPWLLATNLPTARLARLAYARRMWIDETFGDLKKHGFDLESTRLRSFRKLSRLTLAVVLLYVCLVTLGARAIKAGLRHQVDRADRRDLSIFRIGWLVLDRRLVNSQPFSIYLCPYFT